MNQIWNDKSFFDRNSDYVELPINSGIRVIGENRANKEILERIEVNIFIIIFKGRITN